MSSEAALLYSSLRLFSNYLLAEGKVNVLLTMIHRKFIDAGISSQASPGVRSKTMKVIAFVTQKGGSGKSTMASSLAVAASEAREQVCVIDMDPQASLVRWAAQRGSEDVRVVASTPARLLSTLAGMKRDGMTIAFIDTPAGAGPAATAAMGAADLNLIPSRPSLFDLWASAETCRTMKDLKRDHAFLLNQCPPVQQVARIDESVAELEALGGLISPLIHARVDFQDAIRHGAGVTEINPYGVAADETRALWRSVRRRLARGTQPLRKAA